MAPKNVCVILLDSLNRHMLGSYGSTEFETPNLDRFARERAARFTRHVTGSLPCMPARHDILVGALDFLWKPWGSIEIWEQPITRVLRDKGITSYLATDHPHLFETGGENYHTDFSAWHYVRGHEGDPWRTVPDPSWIGNPERPAVPAQGGGWFLSKMLGQEVHDRPYDTSRTWFRDEADYPGPRTMVDAARFLEDEAPQHDRWFCFVDEFDPHEPFDTPEPWASMYQDGGSWDADYMIWPPYVHGGVSKGHLTEAEARHLRANYGAKLSMIDHWFGRILDAFDRRNLWDDTALIVCTDHGHYLGDPREGHDIWGKPGVPQFEPLGHTPLLIHWPGASGDRGARPGATIDALTTNVDLFATLVDVFDVEVAHRTHGRSLVPLLDGSAESVRDWAIGGVWGNWIQITDGRYKYARAPVESNLPISMFSNRWSTMPVHFPGFETLPLPDQRAWLDTMPGSELPVIRQPYAAGDRMPMWAGGPHIIGRHHLYDLANDPDEQENLAGGRLDEQLCELIRSALVELEAPTEQLERVGLG
ncbi:MAG: sulfatase [Acidimicrobiales bacterium]